MIRHPSLQRSLFDIINCRSGRSSRAARAAALATIDDVVEVDAGGGYNFDHASAAALPRIADQYRLPMELINIFEQELNWRDTHRSLRHHSESQARRLYARVHCDPVLYRNLYRYLCWRSAGSEKLGRCTEQLFRWEKDFHDQCEREVLASWRLHLGSSEVLKWVLDSVRPPGLMRRCFNW